MCGICGWLNWRGGAAEGPLRKMARALSHRGPDHGGFWTESDGRLALAHRRLAILDPLSRSDQPMLGADGRALVFNGEIYNFRSVRDRLEREGSRFHSSGDTEVLLKALGSWGLNEVLQELDGQFAFAFWDPSLPRLLLLRDRIGIKPLFWTPVEEGLVFASELPALVQHPRVRRSIDSEAVARWLQLGYLAGEETLIKGVYSLAPGSLLEATPGGIRIHQWYDPLTGLDDASVSDGINEAAEELEGLIRQSVRRRLVTDVPLGCFLSGGLDSALIVGAAVAEGAQPETLTIKFEGGEDESPQAGVVAASLGLRHRIAVCSSSDFDQDLGRWARQTGDPLADPSFLPTSMVAREARKTWKVALSGDGGDELLSGYPRLRAMPRLSPVLSLPRRLRSLPSGFFPARRWATKLKAALDARGPIEAYQILQGLWPAREIEGLLQRSEVPAAWPEKITDRLEGIGPWTRWRALDILSFLPGRMLAKVDRACMAVGLEARVPLLDHRIVEFLLSLPEELVKDKRLFRRVLGRLGLGQPTGKKRGFEIPLAAWLRGPLRERVGEVLLGEEAQGRGMNLGVIRRSWDLHQNGREDHAEKLLGLAILLAWFRQMGL